jgi:hypothetical protein
MAATVVINRGQRLWGVPPLLGAAVMVAAGIAIAVAHRSVQVLEAWMSAGLASALGVVTAEPFGIAVVFPLDGRNVGFTITPGCSVAFLLPFFFVVAAALLAVGRIGAHRAVVTVVAVSATLFAVNQVRLLIISASMRGWGFETGYERSHILLGSLASTIGVVLGVFLFLYLVTRPSQAEADHG